MCKCTPEIRTPFCGAAGCNWPSKEVRCPRCGKTNLTDHHHDPVIHINCEECDQLMNTDGLPIIPNVAQQPHYTQWKIQPITFITANSLNFCQGNVIKYVMRYKAKNGLEDLKKARVYIDYLIQELETGEVKP